jgi:mono/diheme cytochrome c family protein
MRLLRPLLIAIIVLLIVGAAAFLLWSRQAEIAPIEPPTRSAFPHDLIKKGSQLAAIGNCDVCHTAQNGVAFAGGRPLPTPFGTIFSTNITPDPDTGIGRWSEAAFRRAMREGVGRDGRHLYPAFPYDHFARVNDDDLRALYAFIMTREAVSSRAPANKLPFPLNQRWILAFWKLFYLDKKPFQPVPRRTAEWNRGAYLVEGLGHCGDCHTSRNLLGAEKEDQPLTGGEAEGWVAPALNAASPAPVPWDAAHLFEYLQRGWSAEHGAAAGPMQPIVNDLMMVDRGDVQAMATYLGGKMAEPSPERRHQAKVLLTTLPNHTEPAKADPGQEIGARIFAGACANCHLGSSTITPPRGIDLSLSTVLSLDDPRDAIRIVLDGSQQPDEESGPWMPRFNGALTDSQLAALLGYLRAHYGHGSAWPQLERQIHDIRQSKSEDRK